MRNSQLSIYISLFILLDLIFIFIASKVIPYGGFFPYREMLWDYGFPHVLNSLASFDGIHYILIAFRGYAEYEQAFFPLYPMLIYVVGYILGGNYLLGGLVLSLVAFICGFYFFVQLLPHFTKASIQRVSLFLLFFPTSFYFHAVYTESLFFFLFIGSLYFLQRKNYTAASIMALLCSATRLAGIFLVIPFIIELFHKKKLDWKKILFSSTPLLGFGTYCFYLWKTTGDPLFFFHAQPAFGANRSTNLILLPQVYYRYFKIMLTTPVNFQYFVALTEMLLFSLVFGFLLYELFNVYKQKKLFEKPLRTGFLLFSIINILLPTLTGTFSSVTRYSLLSLSFFIILSELPNKYIRIFLFLIFAILHIVLLGFFTQGYFVG